MGASPGIEQHVATRQSSSDVYARTVNNPTILHVSSRELVQKLRDEILRHHGFAVDSTLSTSHALDLALNTSYDLILIDVEGPSGISEAERLCEAIKKGNPKQRVAYVCNHRISLESDCPEEIIRATFAPDTLLQGVRDVLSGA
jgi:CheY-like chemotaxis protein